MIEKQKQNQAIIKKRIQKIIIIQSISQILLKYMKCNLSSIEINKPLLGDNENDLKVKLKYLKLFKINYWLF